MSTSTCSHCGTPFAPNAVVCSTCGRSSSPFSLAPTQYGSSSSPLPPTPYSGPPSPYASSPYAAPADPYSGSSSSSSNPYSSSSYAPPPPIAAPPAMQPQKKSRRALWIILGSVGGFLLLVLILLFVLGSNAPKSTGPTSTSSQSTGPTSTSSQSTPTQTLQSFCSALNTQDYQSAYNLASKRQQALQTQAQFAANYKSLTNCKASNVNDSAGTGTLTYTFNSGLQLVAGETLVNENGTWKINDEQIRSTPTYTLVQYCTALKKGDYQAAYNLLSNNQHNLASEQQFAANLKSVTNCMVSSADDSAGTGKITYTTSNRTVTANETLLNENGTWKINNEK